LLAKEALEGREPTLDIYRTDAGGDSVDLGGFRQYVHRREAGRRIEWAAEINVASLKGRLAERLASVRKAIASVTIGLELDNEGNPVPGAQPAVDSYELEVDGVSLLRMSRRRDGALRRARGYCRSTNSGKCGLKLGLSSRRSVIVSRAESILSRQLPERCFVCRDHLSKCSRRFLR
jgi:hypothetical protein